MRILVWVLTLWAGGLVLCAESRAATITAEGSDTMVVLAQKWAQAYMASHAGVTIRVRGGGTGTGFAALKDRSTDLANASRRINAREIEGCLSILGRRPEAYRVCLDGLAICVNQANPVRELSVPQLVAIFTGKVTNWKLVGGDDAPITLYSREHSSGPYEFFKDRILKGRDFAAAAQTMPGTAAVLQAVAKDRNGVGYGGAADGRGARHLAIKEDVELPAVEPTEANLINGSYPLWRYLYIYVNPAFDKGQVAAYLDWIRGDEGQRIAKETGYYPLPVTLRR